MYKLIVTLRKHDSLSREAFIDHYENRHMPLMAGLLPSPLVSRRNYVIADDPVLTALVGAGVDARVRAAAPYDVMTEAVYGSAEEARSALATMFDPAIAARVKEDEARFVATGSIGFHGVEVRQSAYPWN